MKQEIKARWVEALRSGEYEQGSGYLRRPTFKDDDRDYAEPAGYAYCCLGVLCELAVADGVVPPARPDCLYDHEATHLPVSVAEWAGIDVEGYEGDPIDGKLPRGHGEDRGSLVDLNDSAASFSDIADVIERHL